MGNHSKNYQTKQTIFKTLDLFVVNFFRETSIHGFAFVVKYGSHILERIVWWLCIIFAIYGTVFISLRAWLKYQSPVVISIDRNMFYWNTTFPSATACPINTIDDRKIDTYLKLHPEKCNSENDTAEFKNFIRVLFYTTFENPELSSLNRTFGIESSDYLDLIYNLSLKFEAVTSDTVIPIRIQETVTELGLCYSFNSNVAIYNSQSYWKNNRWDRVKANDTITVHPLDGEMFSLVNRMATAYAVFFHSDYEYPETAVRRHHFLADEYATVTVSAQETITSKSVAKLTISQRKCRFIHENDKLKYSPIYTYNQCRMDCRLRFTLKKCGCIPHFYRPDDRNGKIHPVCNVTGWSCIATIKDNLIKQNYDSFSCDCERNCDDSTFYPRSIHTRWWTFGASFQWGITEYPKMQLRREMIFAFTDLLVYIGGTAGLFLGSSLLSITEVIYFFTWRLIKTLLNRKINVVKKH